MYLSVHEIYRLYATRSIITVFTRRSLDPILNPMNPVHILVSYFSNFNFEIILCVNIYENIVGTCQMVSSRMNFQKYSLDIGRNKQIPSPYVLILRDFI
jgi:hypothetical protein